MGSTRGIRLCVEGRWLCALVAIMLLGGSAGAGESRDRTLPWARGDRPEAASARSSSPAKEREVETESRLVPFAHKRILPRVSIQLEAITAFRHAEPNRDIGDQVLFEEMSREVRRGVERATRRAVKDFLIQATEVDRLVERLRHRRRSLADPAGERPGRTGKVRFDVGFHRLLPEVEMRYGAGHLNFKFSADAEGALKVQYRDNRMRSGQVVAGFDGDDTYQLYLRVGF